MISLISIGILWKRFIATFLSIGKFHYLHHYFLTLTQQAAKVKNVVKQECFFINKAPIYGYSKRQPTVESSNFGAEFREMKKSVELTEALRYKLCIFGVSIEGPTSVFCDNEVLYKITGLPESTLNKKHHSIDYHIYREDVSSQTIRAAKEGKPNNLADLFTKLMIAA